MSQSTDVEQTTVREAVGVFHDWQELQAAVDELLRNGFSRSDLSLLANEKEVEEKLGHPYRRVAELEDDPDVPRRDFTGVDSIVEGKAAAVGTIGYLAAAAAVGLIVASGGTLATVIIGAVAAGGGGALIGTRLAKALGRNHAQSITAQIGKGGVLLWVNTADGAHEERATAILKQFGAEDVHVHTLSVALEPEHDPLADAQPDPFLPGART